jgi:hypothetical protein
MEEQRQRQERDWWKIGGIGCLSVIALGAILLAVASVAVLIAAYSSGGGESVQQQGQDQGQQHPAGRDYLKLSGTAGSASCLKVEDDEGSRSVDAEIPNEIELTAGAGSRF